MFHHAGSRRASMTHHHHRSRFLRHSRVRCVLVCAWGVPSCLLVSLLKNRQLGENPTVFSVNSSETWMCLDPTTVCNRVSVKMCLIVCFDGEWSLLSHNTYKIPLDIVSGSLVMWPTKHNTSFWRKEVFSHGQQVHWIKKETKRKAKTGHDLSLNEFSLIELFTSNYNTIKGEHWRAELY